MRVEDDMEAGLREWLGKVTFCVNISKFRVQANRAQRHCGKGGDQGSF